MVLVKHTPSSASDTLAIRPLGPNLYTAAAALLRSGYCRDLMIDRRYNQSSYALKQDALRRTVFAHAIRHHTHAYKWYVDTGIMSNGAKGGFENTHARERERRNATLKKAPPHVVVCECCPIQDVVRTIVFHRSLVVWRMVDRQPCEHCSTIA